MSEQITRGQAQDLLANLSKREPTFREALLKDPKTTVEAQLGVKIPTSVTLDVVEETSTTMYVVVPFVPKAGGQLSDKALEEIAGGAGKIGGMGGSGGDDTFTINNNQAQTHITKVNSLLK